MKLRSLLGLVFIATIVVEPLAAQGFKDGDRMLQGSLGFFHQQGSDQGTLSIDVTYSKFVTSVWELGVSQGVGVAFLDGADDIWSGSTIGIANYHFRPGNNVSPFVGAFVGASYNENDSTGTIGPNLGVKALVGENAFVLLRYRYEWFFDSLKLSNIDMVGDNRSDGNHVVTVGLGYRF
jgi:hypothetical protein